MSELRSNSFSIIELLQYVRRNSETGRLTFEENGSMLAELYFRAGHIIHASNGKNVGDDVVYQLLGNRTAKIRWEKSHVPTQESVTRTDEALLLGALGILTENDAEDVLKMVSEEAQQAMEEAFEDTPTYNDYDPSATMELARETQPIPIMSPNPPTPILTANAQAIEQMGQLQTMLGDEVLRPPRFRKWTGLPLPFVSAYSLSNFKEWRVIRSVLDLLWKEKFSGYLSIVTNNNNIEALIIFYKGRAVHSRYAENKQFFKDQNALRRIVDLTMVEGERTPVLIYPLEPDFVRSYSALIMGEKLLDSFSSTSMKINKLLNTLEHSRHTGVVMVSNDVENGYIFLSEGHKLGSYYEVEDVLEESILRVYQIVGKPGSIIDVITSAQEDKMFEVASRPKSAAEIKQQMIELAHEVLGKRANRVVNLLAQAEDNAPSLKTYANQARRVTQMFIDKSLADQLYEKYLFLIQELN